jgi:hypothetical protein
MEPEKRNPDAPIGCTFTNVPTVRAVNSGIAVMVCHRRTGQRNRNCGGQITDLGGCNLRPAFRIELQMFAFFYRHTCQARVYSLLNSTRGNDLVERDAELSISVQLARGPHLQD